MGNYEIMFTLLLIVVVGYVAGKVGYMGGQFDTRLSSIVVNITCPALILSSTMNGQLPDRRLILPLLGISLLTYALLSALSWWLSGIVARRPADRGVVAFAMIFGNVGFIGYPIVASMFGSEAVFYAAVLNVVNTFAVFTVGTALLEPSGERPVSRRSRGKSWVQRLYSVPMLAAYMAMLIVALGIDNVPVMVSQTLTMVGNITVPAALMIVGSAMSQLPPRAMLGNRTVYLTALFRLGLLPLGLFFLFRALGFDAYVVNINTIVIAMPVATYGTILCLKYGHDTALITELTLVTTLLSVLTIPLMAMLF